MSNKYFGTDGIRGTVNQGNITGEKFFKFGLASSTYFKNQKKFVIGYGAPARVSTITNFSNIDKGLIKFNNSIFEQIEDEEFNQAHSQFSYLSQSEIFNCFPISSLSLDSLMINLIKSVGGISWTINNYDQRAHHGIKIKKYYSKNFDNSSKERTSDRVVCV